MFKVVRADESHRNAYFILLKKWNKAIEILFLHFRKSGEGIESDVLIFTLKLKVKQKVLLARMWRLEAKRLL